MASAIDASCAFVATAKTGVRTAGLTSSQPSETIDVTSNKVSKSAFADEKRLIFENQAFEPFTLGRDPISRIDFVGISLACGADEVVFFVTSFCPIEAGI